MLYYPRLGVLRSRAAIGGTSRHAIINASATMLGRFAFLNRLRTQAPCAIIRVHEVFLLWCILVPP